MLYNFFLQFDNTFFLKLLDIYDTFGLKKYT